MDRAPPRRQLSPTRCTNATVLGGTDRGGPKPLAVEDHPIEEANSGPPRMPCHAPEMAKGGAVRFSFFFFGLESRVGGIELQGSTRQDHDRALHRLR
jgi:hypothetical protein